MGERIELTINVLSLEDEFLIIKFEDSSFYRDILNKLGGVARDLARSLQVTLNSPDTKRVAIAESVDLRGEGESS